MLSSSKAAQSLFDNEKNLIRTNNGLILSEEAVTHATKTMTLSAKAAELGIKTLSIAGNIIIFMAISKEIELSVKGIDELAHSAEHCKERLDELMSNYHSALDKANSNAKTAENLTSRYEESCTERNVYMGKD